MEAIRQYVRERIAVEDHGFATRCWIWQLSLNCGGYGQGHAPGTPRVDLAHRFSYRAFVGPIPAGLHLDHLCRVRDCCNPDHLEPVTPAENTRRAIPHHRWESRTHCKRGHELTPDNVLTSASGRRCRTCFNDWQRGRERAPRSPIKNPHTHCDKGHELTPENTIIWKNSRRCRTCNVAWRAANDDHRARFRVARQRRAAARKNQRGEGCNGQRPPEPDDIARRHVEAL